MNRHDFVDWLVEQLEHANDNSIFTATVQSLEYLHGNDVRVNMTDGSSFDIHIATIQATRRGRG